MSGIRAFFEAYAESFTKAPADIAAFFAEPCMTARGGTVRVHRDRRETEAFFAGVAADLKARGFRRGAIAFLMEQSLGANSAIATIQWAFCDVDGRTLWQSMFSYNLYRFGGEWKILLQTMHDPAS